MTTSLYLITGQSLATGLAPALRNRPVAPDRAFCLTGGPVAANGNAAGLPIRPLSEIRTETIASGFAAQLLAQDPNHKRLIVGQAWRGQPYASVKKGGNSGVYEALVAQAQLAETACQYLEPGAILLLHGETDGALGTVGYDRMLKEWLNNLQQDVSAALERDGTMPMLFCQTSSISGYCNGQDRSHFQTPLAQLQASRDDENLVLIGPKYALDYIDWAHLDARSTRFHGEQFAKVLSRLKRGEPWAPLSPNYLEVDGTRLRIHFHVPAPPLVIDTDLVTDPGHFGFYLEDPVAKITGLEIVKPKVLDLTLSAPVQANAKLSYALQNGKAGISGRKFGARGCLRDSDPTTSEFGYGSLFNWCVAFSEVLPSRGRLKIGA
ncbi:MAG: sialate O-acetylesterase [Pseudoruegeria sp.]